jgi:hypothetical protein
MPASNVHHILQCYDHVPNATMVVGGGHASRDPHALALVEYRMAKMCSSFTPSPLPH